MKIAFLAPAGQFFDAILSNLKERAHSHTIIPWPPREAISPAGVQVLIAAAPVTQALMTSLPDLALVQTVSDGYESIDLDAATTLGVRVSNAPADLTGNSDSVAEYAVMLMLATARNLPLALAAVRDSSKTKPGRGRTLLGSSVCIAGMGSIGKKIAERLLTFGVHLSAVDRSPAHIPKHIPAYPLDRLKEAIATADFFVLCLRATNENVHFVDASVIAAMKPGAILINIARGSLVDEKALYEAVRSGRLAGAGLDVEEHEPVPPDDPLLTLPQIFLTPHQAGLTQLNIEGTTNHILDVLARIEEGKPLESQVNHPPTPRPLNQ
jgi:D-3-phosphoglycerate dehydrogenase